MPNWKFLPALIGMTIFAAIFVYVAFYFVFLDLFVDYWWFQDLKFEGYFWLRLLYRFILSGGVTLFFFAIFFLHFWIATRYLGLNPPDEVLSNPLKRQRFQLFSDLFMSGSLKFYTPLSLVLAVFIALPFYSEWESGILFFFGYFLGPNSGLADPVFGYDANFYLLAYPIFILIQKELLLTALIVFLTAAVLYWLEHIFVPNQRREYPLGVKIHLTILIGFILLFVTWGFMLERFTLLYVDRHEPIFTGPGFVELRYHLPLILVSAATFLCAAIAAIILVFTQRRGAAKMTVSFMLLFAVSLLLHDTKTIPNIIESLYVKPNPVKAEKRFMQYNIEATLAAYDLNKIKTVDYKVSLDPTSDIKRWASEKHLENIPIWDREFLDDVYNQLQGIRPYYHFPTVDEGRYFLHGHTQQVNLAAREINISKLPQEAQNWENTHLRFTHGYGAVVTPAAADGNQPLTWYLRDLNLHSDVGFSVAKPDIYYGLENYNYAIVPNNLKVMDISGDTKQYEGKGGISLRSLFRKALLAFYLGDHRIFFTTYTNNDSKMLFRRNIVERIKTLTPYLHLDNDPYLVVANDHFYWVQDAYTLSDRYPVSKATGDEFLDGHKDFNYIRNSVKIIVNAYHGDVQYYVSDPSDAIIRAYMRAYPGVFKDLSQVPAELKTNLRYPREMYYIQMQMYAKYHQRQPELFFQQAETWQAAQANNKTVKPYFVTLDFGNCNDREEFVLLNPMTPINRGNLSMIGVASVADNDTCSDAYKQGITVYKFRRETQVNGPAQVDALINQTPEVAELFTLWDQHGSKVLRGRMIILPMGNSMLYVQPVYLMATSTTTIPELVRVIVSINDKVVMDKSLRDAFQRLHNMFLKSKNNEGIESEFPLPAVPAPLPPKEAP